MALLRNLAVAVAALGLCVGGILLYPQAIRQTYVQSLRPFAAAALIGAGVAVLFAFTLQSRGFLRREGETPPALRERVVGGIRSALFAAWILVVVEYTWRETWVTSAGLAAGCVVLLVCHHSPRDLLLFFAAAILGPFMEWVCVREYDFWRYQTVIGGVEEWGIPIWLPLVWGYLFVLFRCLARNFEGLLRAGWAVVLLLLPLLAYLMLCFQVILPAIAITYAVVAVITLTLWRREADLWMLLVAGSLGTLGEALSVKAGIWSYAQPVLVGLGIPISLPFAWGLSGILLRRISLLAPATWRKPKAA